MPRYHQIPIIAGYKRNLYLTEGKDKRRIPSDDLLHQIVNFPLPQPDPFNVDSYRIRDRDNDLDNQRLLQQHSNAIVDELLRRTNNPTELDFAHKKFCEQNYFDYPSLKYSLDLKEYLHLLFSQTF